MAYSASDTMVIVRGVTGSTEEWSNTWCVDRGIADVQDVVDLFHDFYANLFNGAGFMYNSTASASSVRVVDLATGDELAATWSNITGTASGDSLPTECAIRISLRSATGSNGGPFLPAPYAPVLQVAGHLDDGSRDAIKDALQDLWDGLFAIDVNLSLNSPADEVLNGVVGVRVGTIFDAMRSRRSDLAENYATVTPPS